MATTYNPFASDKDRVRFHIGDVDMNAAKFSDEEIVAIITETGGWKQAAIACIKNLIARLALPDFRADWLQVDNKSARDGYMTLLRLKQAELGVSNVTAGGADVYRGDSLQSGPPDYTSNLDTRGGY